MLYDVDEMLHHEDHGHTIYEEVKSKFIKEEFYPLSFLKFQKWAEEMFHLIECDHENEMLITFYKTQ